MNRRIARGVLVTTLVPLVVLATALSASAIWRAIGGGTGSATAAATWATATPPTVTIDKPTASQNFANSGSINNNCPSSNTGICGTATAGTNAAGAASSLGAGAVTLTLSRTNAGVTTFWSGSAWGVTSTNLTATGTTSWLYGITYAQLRLAPVTGNISGSASYTATVNAKNAANISGTAATRTFTSS